MGVCLFDTTLRDGCQQAGISLSVNDKLKIARKLDEFGIRYIEGGWPGSNPKDLEFFRRAREMEWQQARIVAFGSTRRPGARVGDDPNVQSLLESGVGTACIFGKSWDFHVTEVLGTTLAENLSMIRETVSFLKDRGMEVVYDAEHFFDGYKANPGYALETLVAAREGGADWIVLCDTNGGLLPFEMEAIIARVKEAVDIPLGIHAHNDGGMAVANSVMAVHLGVRQVQGTINGYGERCGNADLCSVIPNLQLKLNLKCVRDDQLEKLTSLSWYVSEIANLSHSEAYPFVGQNAFTHKAGVHVSAVSKHPESYEHIPPERVGNSRRVLVSELSGQSNVLYKARERGLELAKGSPEARAVLDRIKVLEYEGYQFEGAEASFELLVHKATNRYRKLFSLEGFRVIVEKREDERVLCEATIKVRVGEEVVHTAAEGNGPVNALDNALRKALQVFFPSLAGIRLIDYKVRVIDGRDGTGAKVRVLIESGDEGRTWGTVGVSTNIIEASWQALVDSIEYGLGVPTHSR